MTGAKYTTRRQTVKRKVGGELRRRAARSSPAVTLRRTGRIIRRPGAHPKKRTELSIFLQRDDNAWQFFQRNQPRRCRNMICSFAISTYRTGLDGAMRRLADAPTRHQSSLCGR
jgi:hypothetical protein